MMSMNVSCLLFALLFSNVECATVRGGGQDTTDRQLHAHFSYHSFRGSSLEGRQGRRRKKSVKMKGKRKYAQTYETYNEGAREGGRGGARSGRSGVGGSRRQGAGGADNVCTPLEAPLPGVLPGTVRPKIIIAQDIDYPPYAELGPPEEDFPVSGFGADFARIMNDVCDMDVVVVQTQWERCWGNNRIGEGLGAGEFHGCSTYTHTAGVRNRFLDFTAPILQDNKPAGLLTRLDENGNPAIDGNSNLDGIRVIDVVGWAPTSDNLALIDNFCTGEKFSGYTIVEPSEATEEANDDALRALLNGEGDVVWMYADQVERFKCENNDGDTAWDCTLWQGLGTDFAYIQTGSLGWARNGTTLALTKKGSGLAEVVNPCIYDVIETEQYYDICVEYGLVDDCFVNSFFPNVNQEPGPWDLRTNEQTGDCSTGYCSCPS